MSTPPPQPLQQESRSLQGREDVNLSAKSDLSERVVGLNAGADDYLVKPFEFTELIARLRALGRRHVHFNSPMLQVGNLTYDPSTGDFYTGDQSIKLPSRRRQILEALFRRAGSTVSKQHLQELSPGEVASPEAIDIHISRLRKTLDEMGCSARIVTQYGLGYSLERR